jgi:hypothetical protein
LRRLRAAAARRADLLIFPNEERARLAQTEIGFATDRLRIVWNLPRKSEMPSIGVRGADPLVLYYHGSITPERLPPTVIEAVRRFDGAVRVHIAGFEVPSSNGHIDRLIVFGTTDKGEPRVRYL